MAAIPVGAGTRSALAFRTSITDRETGKPIGSARVSIARPRAVGRGSGPLPDADRGRRDLLPARPDPRPEHVADASLLDRGGGPARRGVGAVRPAEPVPAVAVRALGAARPPRSRLRSSCRGSSGCAAAVGAITPRGRGCCCSGSASRALVLPLVSPLDVVGDHFLALGAHAAARPDRRCRPRAAAARGARPTALLRCPDGRCCELVGRAARQLRTRAGWLLQPKVALTVWALAYGGWHIPAAYDYAHAQPDGARPRARELRRRGPARLEPPDRPRAPRPALARAAASASPRCSSGWEP